MKGVARYARYAVKLFFLAAIFMVAFKLRIPIEIDSYDYVGTVDREAPGLSAGITQLLYLVPSLYSGLIVLFDMNRRLPVRLGVLLRYSAYSLTTYMNFEAIQTREWNNVYNFAFPFLKGESSTLGFEYSRLMTSAIAALLLICSILSLMSFLRSRGP